MKHSYFFLGFLFLITTINNTLFSQNSNDAQRVTSCYLLTNAYIQASPNTIPYYGDILIRDGIIRQVSSSISAPFDAELIDLDSMFVYAGFIDGLTNRGIIKQDKEEEKVKNPFDVAPARIGITPDKLSSDHLDPKSKDFKSLREAGFTLAHVTSTKGMLPGKTALVLTSESSLENAILVADHSYYSHFQSANGAYPATKIGVMSKWKELYKNAEIAQKYNSKYKLEKKGIKRPSSDKVNRALGDMVSKISQVYFKAQNNLDIHQVLKMQNELGFDLVLTDVKYPEHTLSKIKAANIAVLLSLDLPKEQKQKIDSTDLEKYALLDRKHKALLSYLSQASKLQENNIEFGFSTLSSKPKEVHANILRMVANGLSKKSALAALTTNPAKILGVSDVLGTIETGKIANLVVVDTSYFNKKAQIRHVFVDGISFKLEEKKEKKKKSDVDGEENVVNLTGKWEYKMDIPMPNNTGILLIEKVDSAYKIKIANAKDLNDFEEIEEVQEEDGKVSFSFIIDHDGFAMNIGIDLDFDGESFEGTISTAQFGVVNMRGDKVSANPEKQ